MRTHKEDFRPHSIVRTRHRMCAFLGEQPRPIPEPLARYFAESERR